MARLGSLDELYDPLDQEKIVRKIESIIDHGSVSAFHAATGAMYRLHPWLVEHLLEHCRLRSFTYGSRFITTLLRHIIQPYSRPVNYKSLTAAQIRERDVDGRTPLHHAIAFGTIPDLQFLIEANAALEAVDRNGDTPLSYAAYLGYSDKVEHLLLKKANIGHRDPRGYSALSIAIMSDYSSVVRVLLTANASVQENDYRGYSLLALAAEYNAAKVIDVLIMQKSPLYPDSGSNTDNTKPASNPQGSFPSTSLFSTSPVPIGEPLPIPFYIALENKSDAALAALGRWCRNRPEIRAYLFFRFIHICMYGTSAMLDEILRGHGWLCGAGMTIHENTLVITQEDGYSTITLDLHPNDRGCGLNFALFDREEVDMLPPNDGPGRPQVIKGGIDKSVLDTLPMTLQSFIAATSPRAISNNAYGNNGNTKDADSNDNRQKTAPVSGIADAGTVGGDSAAGSVDKNADQSRGAVSVPRLIGEDIEKALLAKLDFTPVSRDAGTTETDGEGKKDTVPPTSTSSSTSGASPRSLAFSSSSSPSALSVPSTSPYSVSTPLTGLEVCILYGQYTCAGKVYTIGTQHGICWTNLDENVRQIARMEAKKNGWLREGEETELKKWRLRELHRLRDRDRREDVGHSFSHHSIGITSTGTGVSVDSGIRVGATSSVSGTTATSSSSSSSSSAPISLSLGNDAFPGNIKNSDAMNTISGLISGNSEDLFPENSLFSQLTQIPSPFVDAFSSSQSPASSTLSSSPSSVSTSTSSSTTTTSSTLATLSSLSSSLAHARNNGTAMTGAAITGITGKGSNTNMATSAGKTKGKRNGDLKTDIPSHNQMIEEQLRKLSLFSEVDNYSELTDSFTSTSIPGIGDNIKINSMGFLEIPECEEGSLNPEKCDDSDNSEPDIPDVMNMEIDDIVSTLISSYDANTYYDPIPESLKKLGKQMNDSHRKKDKKSGNSSSEPFGGINEEEAALFCANVPALMASFAVGSEASAIFTTSATTSALPNIATGILPDNFNLESSPLSSLRGLGSLAIGNNSDDMSTGTTMNHIKKSNTNKSTHTHRTGGTSASAIDGDDSAAASSASLANALVLLANALSNKDGLPSFGAARKKH